MLRYIGNRLLLAVPVIFGTLTLVFLIVHWLPGDPARILVGDDNEADIQYLREQLGLHLPLWRQYLNYMWNSIRGDFGHSFANRQPVMERLLEQLPATLSLAVVSTLFSIAVGVLLGILSAVFRNKIIDYVIRVLSLFAISMPKFWLAILLILLFSVHLKLLPAIGTGSFKHLIMPAFALGVTGAGILARMVRNSVLEVIHEQYVLTLRSKGLSERKILYQHVLRNALLPALTVIGIIFAGLVEGAVVTETVFSRQGIGKLIVDAINQKDIPIIQAAVLICAVFNILINLLVDLAYSLVDPRVRNSF